ncbi:MAG: MMPL family transporter, partial [Alphaproteobacteria bacterium]
LGTLVALSLISFTMLIMLRNLRISLVALIPNLVPVFMAFGLWGFLFGEVNLAVSVVGSFTFGIVVDDTTHILTKYLYARRKLKLEPNEAMVHVFESVGSAMVLTSITLVAGFVVLTFSGFAVSYQMGFLSAITILIAAIVEVLLLPPIVIAIGESRRKRKTPA